MYDSLQKGLLLIVRNGYQLFVLTSAIILGLRWVGVFLQTYLANVQINVWERGSQSPTAALAA